MDGRNDSRRAPAAAMLWDYVHSLPSQRPRAAGFVILICFRHSLAGRFCHGSTRQVLADPRRVARRPRALGFVGRT